MFNNNITFVSSSRDRQYCSGMDMNRVAPQLPGARFLREEKGRAEQDTIRADVHDCTVQRRERSKS